MTEREQQILRGSGCELRFDDLSRQLYATDASVYQIVPRAVAMPRSVAEAAAVVRASAEAGIAVIPRGAGTGLAGGAVGEGLVVDFSRYNRRISELDREARRVRVDPGVVLDQLNDYLRPHGLQFGPDVATSSRATLGGMIANNSSGARVPVWGVTADHVLSVDVVLADGSLARFSVDGDSERESGGAGERETGQFETRFAELVAGADSVIARRAEVVRSRMPEGLLKRWPGYQFDRYLRRPSLTELISGSEGTLAAIVSAELNLVPIPARRGMGLLFFASVEDAMQATVELLDLQPAAIEHIDRPLFDQTRGQLVFASARALLRLDEEPCEAILIVEFIDHVDDKLDALARRTIGTRRLILRDAQQQALVWGLRKSGLALLTGRKGAAKPVSGIEDVAVRPEQLPAYVAGLRSILDPLGLEASYYGHAATGLLHVRPIVDLHTAEGVAQYRHIAESVSALTAEFGASLAGEHGVGIARTEFLARHIGPELMDASRELKALFDPSNRLNPGKIVPWDRAGEPEPYRIDRQMRREPGRPIELPFAPVLGFVEKDESFLGNLEQCNGNGACLKNVATMCPTYLVTHEEVMSTRGRANTIRAALEHRLGPEPLLDEGLEVALGSCLSCKACKNECPSNVDMALLKAEVLHARQKAHGASLLDRVIASADLLGRLGCVAPRLANATLHWRPLRWLMERVLGIAAARPLPEYALERFDRWFARRGGGAQTCTGETPVPHEYTGGTPVPHEATGWKPVPQGQADTGETPVPHSPVGNRCHTDPPVGNRCHTESPVGNRCHTPSRRVVLWDDTWVRYHEPGIGQAAVRVLEAAGFAVVLAEGRKCCGRPAFSRGLLDDAAMLGAHNVALLESRYPDLPVIFLEPSCHSMFVDDYLQLRIPGAERLARRCQLFEQFMCELLDGEPDALSPQVEGGTPVAVHVHCHAKALGDATVMKRLVQHIRGAEPTLLDTGCCGMAGAFGMSREKYDLSLQVAEPMVEKLKALAPGTQVVASGTSCRHQITHLTPVRPLHMAEVLAAALEAREPDAARQASLTS